MMLMMMMAGEARTLALAGYAVYGMDYPGFGMSEGLHGYIPNFDKLVDEVIEQYRIIKGTTKKSLPETIQQTLRVHEILLLHG